MNAYYAGIGSREAPENILQLMMDIGFAMAQKDWILRSGGAGGADIAFEIGARRAKGSMEIYVPWKGFNYEDRARLIGPAHLDVVVNDPLPQARTIASHVHPNWGACSEGARKLHTRNVSQVMGMDLSTHSKAVICWTPNAAGGGGTGQAIRLAKHIGIPVYDLANPLDRNMIMEALSL